MALTVTTDLTNITTAESITNWLAIGTQSPALEPDFYVQGSNSISRAVTGSFVARGMWFDNGAGIDFTTGTHKDKLVYIWMRSNTAGLMDTRAGGGLVVRLGTTTGDWREWAVGGSDAYPANEGWICYVINPQSAGTFNGGSYNANSVRYFGGVMKTTTTAKGQNFGIDRISYGRGEVYVSGTVTTAGNGFKEIAAEEWGQPTTGRWGIITVKDGTIFVRGKIIIGHATNNTTFSSYNENVVFVSNTFYNGTNVVNTIPNASTGGTAGADGNTSYFGLAFRGGTGTTTIDMGVIAGTDNGRSGSTFNVVTPTDLTTPAKCLSTVAASNDSMALSLYATSFNGFEGAIDLYGTNLANDDMFACTFSGCGRVDSNMEMRNVNILNSVASTTDGAYLWRPGESNIQKSLFVNNSRAIVFETGTGGPFTYTDLTFSGNTFDTRNESGTNITINTVRSGSPTKEQTSGTITYVNSTNLTLTGLKNPTEVRVFNAGTTTAIAGQENVTSGTFSTGIDAATYTSVDIAIISLGYQNIRLLGVSTTSDITIPIQQVVDRQYLNP